MRQGRIRIGWRTFRFFTNRFWIGSSLETAKDIWMEQSGEAAMRKESSTGVPGCWGWTGMRMQCKMPDLGWPILPIG